jgi:hypothetical protein
MTVAEEVVGPPQEAEQDINHLLDQSILEVMVIMDGLVEAEAIMVVEEVSLEEADRHIMIRHGWC